MGSVGTGCEWGAGVVSGPTRLALVDPVSDTGTADPPVGGERAGYGAVAPGESVTAARRWWDDASTTYLDEHGATLGTDTLVWGPEGLDEDAAHLLGPAADLAGARVLEVGCGGGQGARWAARRGARAVGVDTSFGMLTSIDASDGGPALVQADARALPLPDGWADAAFSAYGALPFVADVDAVLAEVARVLVPGGRWVFSASHPVRWGFPDVPGEEGLTATRSYFDRTPYAERDEDGRLLYAEHHRTVGDWVRLLVAAGFVVDDVVEPQWPAPRADGREQPTWGGWSALRGTLLPGTVIFVTHLEDRRTVQERAAADRRRRAARRILDAPDMEVPDVAELEQELDELHGR